MSEQHASPAEDALQRIYGHVADRMAQHYHLPLTPEMWAEWNAAIHHRTPEAMFVLLRQDGVTFWRVWHGTTPVFILYRDGLIRTALSVMGTFYRSAIEEARKIGQTALGNELKPLEAAKRLTLEDLREQDGLNEVRELARRQKQRLVSIAENERRHKEKLLNREKRILLEKASTAKNKRIKEEKILAQSVREEGEKAEKQRRKSEKLRNELAMKEAFYRWDDDGGAIRLVACLRHYPNRFLNEDDDLYTDIQRVLREGS